jgi:hypothetical protein
MEQPDLIANVIEQDQTMCTWSFEEEDSKNSVITQVMDNCEQVSTPPREDTSVSVSSSSLLQNTRDSPRNAVPMEEPVSPTGCDSPLKPVRRMRLPPTFNVEVLEDKVRRALGALDIDRSFDALMDLQFVAGRVDPCYVSRFAKLGEESGRVADVLAHLDTLDLPPKDVQEVLIVDALESDDYEAATARMLAMQTDGYTVPVKYVASLCRMATRLSKIEKVIPLLSSLHLKVEEIEYLRRVCVEDSQVTISSPRDNERRSERQPSTWLPAWATSSSAPPGFWPANHSVSPFNGLGVCPGIYKLPDGTPFQAGVSLIPTGGLDFWAISFHEPFDCAPAVIARVVADGESWKLEKHPAQRESFTVRVVGPQPAHDVPLHWMAFKAPEEPRNLYLENGTSLPCIPQVELRELRFKFDKEPGVPLGLMYVAEKWSLRVTGVGGFLKEWARKMQPQEGLLIGDRIIEVNDVQESGERLREEILSAKASAAISLSVQREETAYVSVPAGILGE